MALPRKIRVRVDGPVDQEGPEVGAPLVVDLQPAQHRAEEATEPSGAQQKAPVVSGCGHVAWSPAIKSLILLQEQQCVDDQPQRGQLHILPQFFA